MSFYQYLHFLSRIGQNNKVQLDWNEHKLKPIYADSTCHVAFFCHQCDAISPDDKSLGFILSERHERGDIQRVTMGF